jgi:hypothetical protein
MKRKENHEVKFSTNTMMKDKMKNKIVGKKSISI